MLMDHYHGTGALKEHLQKLINQHKS